MASLKQVQRDSAELRRLNDRINATIKTRGDSPAHRADWEHACAEFHRRIDSLAFPGGSEALGRVRYNDPNALDAAVKFLVADPYHFRSGYIKEYLWHWLQHCRLSPSHRNSLESAALLYLERRISREFWSMCKAMARLGRSDFWSKVAARAQVIGTPEAFRASCLLTYGANVHAGANLRRSIHRSWLMRKYGGG
jgi:hypothetical protein